jgi:hypothetical protein
MVDLLINTADLKERIASDDVPSAKACSVEGVEGYLLRLKFEDGERVMSTYLSDKPRLFKRSDALLKEAEKLGLGSVTFELQSKQ